MIVYFSMRRIVKFGYESYKFFYKKVAYRINIINFLDSKKQESLSLLNGFSNQKLGFGGKTFGFPKE